MTDSPAYPWEQNSAEPAKKTMFSAIPTPEEIERWGVLMFQVLGKSGKLPQLRDDLDLIASHHVHVDYHPFWFIKNKVLSGYVCWERRRKPSDIFNFSDGRVFYDLMILNKAVTILQAMQEKKEQTLLIVPVHIKTLCDRRARDLLRYFCENYAAPVSRGLVFMIQGTAEYRLLESDFEHIFRFATFCRTFILETLPSNAKISPYMKLKLHACGFAVDAYKGEEKKLFEQIEAYAMACEKFGIKSFMTGVDKMSIMTAAIAAGITYLQGSAISGETDAPRHVEFMGIDSVYKQHIFPEQ